METHAPRYYASFRCLAGACPHTCCAAGWEVPVDSASAARYAALPGLLGKQVRAFLEMDPEGEPCLPLRGGVCPFLNREGLCHIHIELGGESTPLICRTHPRFSYNYGSLRERGLCGSCPEAARLILGGDMELTTSLEDGPEEDTPPLLSSLLQARTTALGLLSAEETTLPQRFQALLLFANEVQVLLDEEQAEAIPPLCEFYREEFPFLSLDPDSLPPRQEVLEKCLSILEGLAILRPRWKTLLAAGKACLDHPTPPPSGLGERAAAYFLYRHWLRGVWDGDVLTWAEFAVLGTVVTALLAPQEKEGFSEVFRQFCLELEHSEANMTAIQDALWDVLSLPDLLSIAGM